jgi:hypothetical protein
MPSALYYPIIRGRQGEISALHHLSPTARARIAPLVDLPTGAADDSQSLDDYVGGFIAALTPAWGTEHPIYVDLTRDTTPDTRTGVGARLRSSYSIARPSET